MARLCGYRIETIAYSGVQWEYERSASCENPLASFESHIRARDARVIECTGDHGASIT